MRGRAEAARQAHNLEVGGSSPSPATSSSFSVFDRRKYKKDFEEFRESDGQLSRAALIF